MSGTRPVLRSSFGVAPAALPFPLRICSLVCSPRPNGPSSPTFTSITTFVNSGCSSLGQPSFSAPHEKRRAATEPVVAGGSRCSPLNSKSLDRRRGSKRKRNAVNFLAISGSLRASSSNTTLLRALPLVADPRVVFTFSAPLDRLPYFNPDVEESKLPASIADWRVQIRDHDALVLCSPEYAHGVPGVLKNALDWLVGGMEIVGKPIAVLNTSLPSTTAHTSLLETLTVMGGRVIPEASVGLVLRGLRLNEAGMAAHPELSPLLRGAMSALVAAVLSGVAQP
jgi:chromate reductase, NAD(P)H dehydrogenase (quinone)